jgi:hypothetical protein
MMRFSTLAFLATTLSAACSIVIAQTSSPKSKSGQEQQWKEYVYPNDGFAIKFPYAPTPHKDSQVPDGTAYTISSPVYDLSLHVANVQDGCASAFSQYLNLVRRLVKQLREGTLDQSQSDFRVDASSAKEITVGGYPAVEYEQEVKKSKRNDYERIQCVNKKLYMFTALWAADQSKPADVKRIVDSFRLLAR